MCVADSHPVFTIIYQVIHDKIAMLINQKKNQNNSHLKLEQMQSGNHLNEQPSHQATHCFDKDFNVIYCKVAAKHKKHFSLFMDNNN